MYVCVCKGVTDKQIRAAVEQGHNNMRQLKKKLCVGSECGLCVSEAKEVARQHQQLISIQAA